MLDSKIPKLKPIELKEREELEPMLISNPDIIEEGMKILDHQLSTDSGPLDILAVDTEGVITIIELKNEIDEGQLDQGLRYYDWVRTNIAWLGRAFSDIDVNLSPRLILIAPNFSEELRRIAKYVNVELELKQYQAVELSSGEKTIICSNVVFGTPPEPEEIPTIQAKIDKLESDRMRQLATECITHLKSSNIEVKAIHGRWMSAWYKSKRFMYIGIRKKFFICEVEKPDGNWTGKIRILSNEDWNKLYNDHIVETIKYLDNKQM